MRIRIVAAVAAAATVAAGLAILPGAPAGAAGASTAVLARLSLEQQVGQLLMVGVPATGAGASALQQLGAFHVGGVIFTGRSSAGTAATANLAAQVQAQGTTAGNAGVPLLVSTDQEGGAVQVLSGPGFSAIPSALSQGAESTTTLRSQARSWGNQLRSAGIRVNLAPVADTVPAGANNPPIGNFDRQYGSTPATVSAHAGAFAAGMEDAGVTPTVKHFPGLGRVTANTDTTAGVTDSVTTRTDPFLAPFRDVSRIGAPFLMMSTAIYSRIDPANPAAFSPTVLNGMVRGDLGFTGVVMSDDLGNARQVSAVPAGDRAVRFVGAGGDVVLTVNPATLPAMYDALLTRARSDAGFRARVSQSAHRVLLAKQRLGLLDRVSERGDFTGDGRADRAIFRPADGTWHAQGAATVAYGVSGDVPLPADYTGDGRADQAVYRPSDHTWHVRGLATVAYGTTGDIPVPADYTGDGRVDRAIFRPADGTWHVLGRSAVAYGTTGDIPVPADYTGDGVADLAVFRPSDGSWHVRGGSTVRYGTTGDVPVPGDWTGDSVAEPAVYRPSDNTWHAPGTVTVHWGAAGDVVVPADYTGDGRVDPALFRPSTSTWYVWGQSSVVYGGPGDRPVLDVALVRRGL
jgi:beta-glucosidase-like glycosyl hydrolase